MNLAMSKSELRRRLGIDTDAALARYFHVSTSAVTQWEGAPVPQLRLLQAMTRNPEAFADLVSAARQEPAHAG
jgi:DNA-binding transcriptional regulator YiaG